jgi:aminopeptidase C
VDKLNNMAGGLAVQYVNLPVEELMRYAMQTIDAGQPVWYGTPALGRPTAHPEPSCGTHKSPGHPLLCR